MEVTLIFMDFEILAVNDADFTVTFRGYIRISWNDPRIIGPNSTKELKTPLDLEFLKYLWKPDLEVLHLKQIRTFKFLKKLEGNTHVCYKLRWKLHAKKYYWQ